MFIRFFPRLDSSKEKKEEAVEDKRIEGRLRIEAVPLLSCFGLSFLFSVSGLTKRPFEDYVVLVLRILSKSYSFPFFSKQR